MVLNSISGNTPIIALIVNGVPFSGDTNASDSQTGNSRVPDQFFRFKTLTTGAMLISLRIRSDNTFMGRQEEMVLF
jgi:hypothetical protein